MGELARESAREVNPRSWVEPHPTALCRDDLCPWKYCGVDLAITQRKAAAHVRESGHAVRVYRQLHRDLEPIDG